MIFLWLDFSCGQAVDNFRGRKLFPDEMNGYCLDLNLGKCDRNCCTKDNTMKRFNKEMRNGNSVIVNKV